MVLPESMKAVSYRAFANSCIETVVLHSKIEAVEFQAFCGCSRLADILLPESVKIIEREAFAGTAITDFVFPSGIRFVQDSVFFNCASVPTH